MKRMMTATVGVLLLASACGGASEHTTGVPATPAQESDPTSAYIAQQFATQVDPIAMDAATYRSDVAGHKDAAVIMDAGTLYSEVAFLPKILSNTGPFGHKAQAGLPALKTATTVYANALNAVNGGTVGHLTALEKAVTAADATYRATLAAFAASFGGTVPAV